MYDRRLGAAIRRHVRVTLHAHGGCGVDDGGSGMARHMRQRVFAAEHGARQIDAEGVFPDCEIHGLDVFVADKRLSRDVSRAVIQNVDPAQFAGNPIHRGADLSFYAEIENQWPGPAAPALNFADGDVNVCCMAVRDHDFCPALRQHHGRRRADSAASAGNNRNLIFQCVHTCLSQVGPMERSPMKLRMCALR